MAYFTIQSGAGYFRAQTRELDPTVKAEAELYATMRVDLAFSAWDRTGWTGSDIPVEIAQAAEMIAAGKYLEKIHATGNPQVSETSLAASLIKNGEALLVQIVDVGGPINPDYPTTRLEPIREQTTGRTVRILRT